MHSRATGSAGFCCFSVPNRSIQEADYTVSSPRLAS
uniref:Uncharacterized protein n=1 Tax=Anguilla anguilla TaxID=7936 RepID=A0A0E9RX93_ANGAN